MLLDYIVTKLTTEHHPIIKSERCIQLNSASNICTKCKVNCPKGAIDFNSDKININTKLCNSCGICKGVCPTQAINLKGIGEENIVRTTGTKDNMVFSCSHKNGIGTLKLTCLNSFHPELLSALFIKYSDKSFDFNISRCKDCELNKNNLVFLKSLEKAKEFLNFLGIKPKYKVIEDEESISHISEKNISRRELFSLFRNETTNIATQALDTIITDDNDFLSIRPILLKAIEENSDFIKDEVMAKTLLGTWKVNDNCNGCGTCQTTCPSEAWQIKNSDKIFNIYHNAGKCYKCGKCIHKCSKKAIEEGSLLVRDINQYSLKKQLTLSTCSLCNKEFVPKENESECSICVKRQELRNKIASL